MEGYLHQHVLKEILERDVTTTLFFALREDAASCNAAAPISWGDDEGTLERGRQERTREPCINQFSSDEE